MLIFFGVLILIASVILAIFVLVQNPKGGGLSGTFGGISNLTMGVRQTTDFLEKGTWGLMIFIAVLCLGSSFFMKSDDSVQHRSMIENNVTLPAPTNADQNQNQLNLPPSSSGDQQNAEEPTPESK